MRKNLLFFLVLLSFSTTLKAQSDSTEIKQSGYFLTFVKKVYLNPTVYLRTQDFKENTNLSFVALPDLASEKTNASSGFEKGLQKVLRFLMQSDGGVRFYFNPDSTTHPFRFWYSENLHCKFKQADKDSIDYYLNHNFADGNISMTNALRFETTIDKALDYIEKCLTANPQVCGEEPQNETTEINTKPLSVSLHNRANSKYDIDVKQYEKLESHYAKAFDLHTLQDWYAPAKLLVANETVEPVALAIHSNEGDFLKQNIKIEVLKTHALLPIDQTSTEDSLFFSLPSSLPPGDPVEVIVKYKSPKDSNTYTVGFFMVNVMERETKNLVLIPANGFVISANFKDSVETELEKIYGQASVDFNVTVETGLVFPSDYPTTIEFESSGLFSSYARDMRDYVGEVQDLNDYESENYYLIIGLESTELQGYMPRARNIGFIFKGATNKPKVIAHEIGHGAFHFRHIFSDEELGEEEQGQTNNIMDYVSNPIDLYLHQWNFIKDPAFVSWFGGDDEEGEMFLEKNLMFLENDTLSDEFTLNQSQNTNQDVYYLTRCNTFINIDALNPIVRFGSDKTRISELVINGIKYRLSYSPQIQKNGNQHQVISNAPSCSYISFEEIEKDKSYTVVNSVNYKPEDKKFNKVTLSNSVTSGVTVFYQNIPSKYYFNLKTYSLPICPEGYLIHTEIGFKEVTKEFCEQLLDKSDRGYACISLNNFQHQASNEDVDTLKHYILNALNREDKGYYYYEYVSGIQLTGDFDESQKKIFKDKVGIINQYDQTTKFFVLEYEVKNYPYSGTGVDDLANKALAEIKLMPEHVNKKIGIYLLVRYSYKEGTEDKICVTERFIVSDPSLIGDNFRYSDFNNSETTYKRANYCFAHFSKPFHVTYIYRMVSGQISHKIISNLNKPNVENLELSAPKLREFCKHMES